jgi:hypothetical protein
MNTEILASVLEHVSNLVLAGQYPESAKVGRVEERTFFSESIKEIAEGVFLIARTRDEVDRAD